MTKENDQIKGEMDDVISELEKRGISFNTREDEYTGLGDIVENTLETFGITQERFKSWFNLKECNCNKRKKWLNNLFSWKKKQREEQGNRIHSSDVDDAVAVGRCNRGYTHLPIFGKNLQKY